MTQTEPGPLVLVVDDDARNAKLLSRILEAEGMRTRIAPDGETALALVAAQLPDMVLLDVMMPGLDGYAVCARIKADPRTRSIPTLLVTALTRTEDKVRGLDAGADDFLTKPINRAELLARVRTHFRIKKLHDELEQGRVLLEQQNDKLQQLEAMREELTHMIAHDFKSPLSAIQLNVELLNSVADPDESLRCRTLATVQEAAERLTALVQNLLDVARMQESVVAPRLGPVCLEDLLSTTERQFQLLARGAGLSLGHEIAPGIETVEADRDMLGRVLQNLVANAVKASGPNGDITLIVCESEAGWRFGVADRGPGVPPGLRERIFDKFSGVEAAHAGLSLNHGLGLTFCKLAVEAHGGEIWIEDRAGGGSVFWFELPRDATAVADSERAMAGAV